MKPIQGIDLKQLTKDAAIDLLHRRKVTLSSKIQALYHKADGLSSDIDKLRNEMSGKENKLKATLEKIEKLQAGDWSVLEDEKRESPEKQESKGSNE